MARFGFGFDTNSNSNSDDTVSCCNCFENGCRSQWCADFWSYFLPSTRGVTGRIIRNDNDYDYDNGNGTRRRPKPKTKRTSLVLDPDLYDKDQVAKAQIDDILHGPDYQVHNPKRPGCIQYLLNALFRFVSYPLFFLLINIAIICATFHYGPLTANDPHGDPTTTECEWTNATQTLSCQDQTSTLDLYAHRVGTTIQGASGLYNMVLALMFSTAIAHYNDSIKLYDALCGDIKAFAIWVSTLTRDKTKYDLDFDEQKLRFNPSQPNDDIEEEKKNIVERATITLAINRIRYILAVLAPVAKRVIRQQSREHAFRRYKPAVDHTKLDDQYRVRVSRRLCGMVPLQRNQRCYMLCRLVSTTVYAESNKGKRMQRDEYNAFLRYLANRANGGSVDQDAYWARYDLTTWGSIVNEGTEKGMLFQRIDALVQEQAGNLFEILMYCLMDEVEDLQERQMGLALPNQRDLVMKWNHIYNSYGELMTYNGIMMPAIIRWTMVVSLFIFTVFTSDLTYRKAAPDDQRLFSTDFWVAIFDILPYILLWTITRLIVTPFGKSPQFLQVTESVSPLARETQKEVNNILRPQNRRRYDLADWTNRTTTTTTDAYKQRMFLQSLVPAGLGRGSAGNGRRARRRSIVNRDANVRDNPLYPSNKKSKKKNNTKKNDDPNPNDLDQVEMVPMAPTNPQTVRNEDFRPDTLTRRNPTDAADPHTYVPIAF